MLLLQNLTFRYPNSAPIFAGYNWQVERGDAWAVLGPSGCGKSTLLALVAGLLRPTAGRVLVEGQELARPRPHTGLIIQDYGLLPWATVRENAELGLRIRSFYGPDEKHAPRETRPVQKVEPWLERLDIASVARMFPGQISGGQRQRAAIARTLVLEPDLLLMDEPFSSLDAPTRESLQRLTLELSREQTLTLVLVTHSIEEAAVIGQKILLLSRPPNTRAEVIDNPGAASTNFHETALYNAVCRDLRERLSRP